MNLDLLGLSFWDSLAIAGLVLLPLVSFYVPRSQRSREERLETSTRLFFIYLAALVIWKSQELPTGLDGPRTLPLVFSGLLM
ncbi:MAG: hypothetical protein KDD53_12515, partial [Bdellovibrionales bacterium]|nr:hypothetical protein [Bdellovibrionales bacterium]